MKFILGQKVNMTQVFDEAGQVHPVTVLKAGPIVVTALKTLEKDGYNAAQVGFGERKLKNISKPVQGQMKDLGNFAHVREFSMDAPASNKIGDKIDVTAFKEGDMITISSISKGRGFQGVVKRHGFGGGRRTHGQKHSEREPRSIGGGLRTRVPKNMRMAGRMGSDRVTVKNLQIVKIDPAQNLFMVRGAVPGRRGTLVEVRG